MIPNAARRAPHQGNQPQTFHHAPNAALLIDFDNVTMGIRSDLGKELKALLNSEVIRGKVAVQRAYADWRRYPQYIVPLAESSIDLIFAPAYGSSKKNATDLRMAIDAIELVFTRPEIGTYILMTGDSDFSSCVLKLKEYGKYVIGVGMKESSSDLLVQNCDEYYSYHALSGLTRTDEVLESKEDPWVLLRRAAQQMVSASDVMRTDRLKQVMLDLDPAFDEKKIGYSKFSRFVQEGASKGIIRLRKMENGQHEIEVDGAAPATDGDGGAARPPSRESSNGRGRGRGRGRDRDREETRREPSRPQPSAIEPREADASAPSSPEPSEAAPSVSPAAAPVSTPAPTAKPGDSAGVGAAAFAADDLKSAYGLLQQAVRDLGGKAIRDGDVKRKMIEIAPDFDEGRLGFPKFTRFLRQAHDAEAIDLNRVGAGNYEVSIGSATRRFAAPAVAERKQGGGAEPRAERPAASATSGSAAPKSAPAAPAGTGASGADSASTDAIVQATTDTAASRASSGGMGMRARRGGRGGAPEGPPPLLPGQVVQVAKTVALDPPAPAASDVEVETVKEEKPTRSRSRRGRRGKGAADAADEAAKPDTGSAEKKPAARGAEKKAPARGAEPEAPAAETPSDDAKPAASARRRRGRGKGTGTSEEAPVILPGQAVSVPSGTGRKTAASKPASSTEEESGTKSAAPAKRKRTRSRAKKTESAPAAFSASALGLPEETSEIAQYLGTYKGVGAKTAESMVESFGSDLFRVMDEEPDRVRDLLGGRRSGTLLEQWTADVSMRRGSSTGGSPAAEAEEPAAEEKPKSRSRRGGRGRGSRKKEAPDT
jgi:uncharacterized protein (TIGR00288 family)